MPFYHSLGEIPPKRHTQFRKTDGSLYAEELVSTQGFSSMYSLVYHCHPPTIVKKLGETIEVTPKVVIDKHLKHRNLRGFNIKAENDYLESRKPVLVNNDLHISLAAPKQSFSNYYYKNADADEILFIHKGSGTFKSMYGELDFRYGDYLVIPRGTVYQLSFKDENNRLFIIESFTPVVTPKRYRNQYGQLLEHSPFCERDIIRPKRLETHDEEGDFLIKIKKQGMLYHYVYGTHPFDVIGWDGYHYPYTFSIHNFEPITGRVHLPPPIHQTFETGTFVVCSFVPRLYDYHPQSIPAPYNHSNVDSDEVLYYVDGDFMSRANVEQGMITLHPGGIPHGPHPGTVEKSIGEKETGELAVMVDPFRPLSLTQYAVEIEDSSYYRSWVQE